VKTWRRSCALFALSATTVLATRADAEPVRVVLLSAPMLHALPGQTLPPFRLRVERANGEAVPGIRFSYVVDGCVEAADPPLGSSCPQPFEYGGFDDGTIDYVELTTGSDGTVTTPSLRAGHPLPQHLPFEFHMFHYVPWQTTPSGFTITPLDAVQPIGGLLNGSAAIRIAGEPAAVPALDRLEMMVLALLLAAAGAWKLRSVRAQR
jgi:hypothetical protein